MGKQDTHHTAIKITGKAKNNTFEGCKIYGSVEIEKQAKDNKFKTTEIISKSIVSKRWYEKPTGIILLGTLASLLGWAILRYYGLA